MLFLITSFVLTCFSQNWVDETTSSTTSIYYDQSASLKSDYVTIVDNAVTYINLLVDTTVNSEEIIIDCLNYTVTKTTYFRYYDSLNSPNLKVVRIKPINFNYQYILPQNINDNTHFYYGCFGESGCSFPTVFNLNIYAKSYTMYFDELVNGKSMFLSFMNDNSLNSNGYPYVFIGSKFLFTIRLYIRVDCELDHLNSLSGSFYLYTSFNADSTFVNGYNYTTNSYYYSGFTPSSVCSRKDTNRYVLFRENHTPYTNCSCWTKDNDMDIDSLFNYPDCNYNSTIFDLILTSTSSLTYSLSDDLLKWYSIIFTISSQSIQINDGKTLLIDVLDINQNDISFNGNVNVTNLTITTSGASFNTLDFDDIDTSSLNDDTTLFTIESTTTDLESFELLKCENVVIKTFKTECYCNYNETGFDQDEISCNNLKRDSLNPINLNLMDNVNDYIINENEYWNVLNINESLITLNGSSLFTITTCEFENKTITINCDLYCKTMNINSNTKLINNGELTIDTLVITDQIDNINENGIIESYGSIQITSIETSISQSSCFELISSNHSLSQPSINSDYYLLLSQNHLLRICSSSTAESYIAVVCTVIGNTYEQQSFDLLHCPCIDSNCIINVNTTQLDDRNNEFDGTFNILTNSTIAISYKTSSFTVEYENDKQILLIGNGAVGFETSRNTNSLESETTTLSVKSSNQLFCKALLIQYDNQQCIIEDNTNYPQVGDIENCQLQNGFGCEVCYESYESNVTYCNECPSNCLRCYNNECINCEMNYQLNQTNQCELISDKLIEIFDNNKTMKCNDGYYSNTNQCIQCSDLNCIRCNSLQCLTCNISYTLTNGNCQLMELNNGEEITSNYGVIDCNDGYYSNNSECVDCSLTFDNCELCNVNGCLSCSNGVIINNGSCSLNTNCLNIDYSICLSCNEGSWFNGNECISCGDNCKNCINGYCIECNDGYILQSENNCVDTNEYPDNCITISYYGTCQRCLDGYYLNNNLCYSCSNECTTCHNLTYCFECNDGYMLNNNECVDMSDLNANCKTAIPGSSGGCAICNDGYYRNQTTCKSCISNCNKCNNGESCLICESNYFLLNDASECISYDDLINCETKTQSGCTKCGNNSYYLNNQYCTSCLDTTENCNTCNNNGECLTCQNDHILINYECIHYQLIDNCKESNDSKCTSCSFWHTVNSDQTRCDTQVVWWVIVLIVLFILIILIGICVLIWYVIKQLFSVLQKKKQEKTTTIFDMSRSNIQFHSTNNQDVVINKDEILFNDDCEEIGVNSETRDLICVGNTSKHTIKVQFSVKDGCDKYEIRTNPQLITIQKGKAVEFEIFIKPLCTCSINDQIMLISVDLSKGKTISTPITINAQTIMTTHLDYSELIEDIKLGEGSFGIVYKGTFRGNQVAIKKLKQKQDNKDAIDEFNKEVSMLTKFRNDYIVHFYGAVMIPNKICLVTEFAQYGSLNDLMKNNKETAPRYLMKMKILLDCSKGISYLHSNGILHRDIKPDNFLVLSLDNDVQVNTKLTDFGSSRNINMLMTNMTFTKGVGSPKYMAPEILNREKYKKPADIFSFAVTIYETIIWDNAYDKTQFIYPWDIAEFVANGKRLPKPDTISESIYSLIDNCWKQDVKERYSIEEVIKTLESMFK